MHIVAIHSLNKDKENLAKALASAIGATFHEAVVRLRVPGSGPIVVAVFAEKERAIGLLERLLSEEFKASVLTEDEIGVLARSLEHVLTSHAGFEFGNTWLYLPRVER